MSIRQVDQEDIAAGSSVITASLNFHHYSEDTPLPLWQQGWNVARDFVAESEFLGLNRLSGR